ncbi:MULTISPECIES: hypothetical protein [Gordonia]|uniref:Uncharacterized protein n=1 Tax=Gordonia amicalis TaxID=89053 RepID=A0AAE4R7Z0_9ACTN|nr:MULTISPECIES: hypothetical protein [Gordonia]ATD69192.1 hypothetical protein CNO18_01595 [Gordonia sp. 1D]MCZ4654237.1 hypothetical protein [Gordonia amicalis]MDJ0452108.1 hypothetical protein [Gordonia amicalis]MDV6308179.1 hypothetical protein [Gordonia amicalis]MDV6312010.1 hypothetical protein [Gordonia amicalis]
MSAPTTAPVETLIRHGWDVWEQGATTDYYADRLRDAVWELEEAVDHQRPGVDLLARRVVQALTIATGDEVLAPMPAVAAWLGLDQ